MTLDTQNLIEEKIASDTPDEVLIDAQSNNGDTKTNEVSSDFAQQVYRLEDNFLSGIPRFNIGALFMPPIWGPAHGIWIAILYYPIWLFADNCFYAAYSQPSVLSCSVATVVLVILAAVTVAFARLAQPQAAHRAAAAGKTKEQFLRTERTWAIVSVILGVLMIAFATYYNLFIRTEL